MSEPTDQIARELWETLHPGYEPTDDTIAVIQAAIEKATEITCHDIAKKFVDMKAYADHLEIKLRAQASPFHCIVCGRAANQAGVLYRVSKKDMRPAIWICRDDFNFEDWKEVDDSHERLARRLTQASERKVVHENACLSESRTRHHYVKSAENDLCLCGKPVDDPIHIPRIEHEMKGSNDLR